MYATFGSLASDGIDVPGRVDATVFNRPVTVFTTPPSKPSFDRLSTLGALLYCTITFTGPDVVVSTSLAIFCGGTDCAATSAPIPTNITTTRFICVRKQIAGRVPDGKIMKTLECLNRGRSSGDSLSPTSRPFVSSVAGALC